MANLETKITLSAQDKASPEIRKVGQSLDRLKKSAASISSSYNAMSAAAGDFGRRMRNISLVVAAAGAGIYGIVKSYAALGETLNLTSQKTGVSVENLQKLGYAAELDKVSADDLRMSLQFLNRNMALAKGNPKSPQAEMFKKLGVDVNKTTDAYAVFMQMSDKFAKSSNTSEKNLFARGLMGRGGVNMIPVLNRGSAAIRALGEEYQRLGFVMSAQAAEAADNFGDNLQRLGVATKGLVAIFADQLVPILNPLVIQFTEWVASNKELVKTNVKEFIKGSVEVFKSLVEVFKTIKDVVGPVISAFGGLGNVVKVLALLYVVSLVASFGRLVYAVGIFATSFATMVPAIWAGVTAFSAFAAAALAPLLPIAGIVAAVGLIGVAIYQNFDKIKAKIGEFFDWVSEKYNAVKGFFGMETKSTPKDMAPGIGETDQKIQSIETSVKEAGKSTVGLGDAFKSAGIATIAAMNPLLGVLMLVTSSIEKIKSALASMSSKPITIGVTTSGVPASPAGAAAATPAKTALLTPPTNAAQVASAQSTRTKLDVFMKIDSEGRAKNIKAKSSGNMDFAANTGVMV